MGGDKIVLLDGAGANGGGAATNGLLSMIPGMFANLIGGNKMDPNLVAALMNGRNNQDGFKQTREQDRKIAGIENKVNDLTDSFEDLKKLIVERLK